MEHGSGFGLQRFRGVGFGEGETSGEVFECEGFGFKGGGSGDVVGISEKEEGTWWRKRREAIFGSVV